MRIRTQFLIALAFFGIMLIVIGVSLTVTNQRVYRLLLQEEIAHNIQRGASDLSYFSNEYLLYREKQQLERWETRFVSVSNEVSKLSPGSPEQQAIVTNINGALQRLRAVFTEVVQGTTQASGSITAASLQVPWSRLTVQNQAIFFDALRLSEMMREQADRLRMERDRLISALIALFGVFLVFYYLLTYRRTLRSIAMLQEGIGVIGSGNLDFKIEERYNDEIGDVSRAFNRMTANLKTVTASKAELEMEITERKAAAEALRKSEEKFRIVSNFTYDWEYWRSTDNRFIYVSPSCLRITGYTDTELVNNPAILLHMIHPADREKMADHMDEGLHLKDPGVLEFRIIRRDGQERWIGHTCQPIVDAEGNILGRRASNRDVTERKKAEEALKESEEKYRSLFSSMSEGFALHEIVLDASGKPCDYRFLEMNDSFERLTGLSRENAVGKTIKEILPGIESYWIETYGRVALTGEPVHFENYSASLDKWYSVYAYSPGKNRFAVVFTDISDRRKAEAEILHLASFPELNPNPVVELDAAGNISYANPAAKMSIPGLLELGNKHPFLTGLEELLNKTETHAVSRDIDIGELWFEQVVSYVPDTGSYRLYARDITARIKAEEALRRYAAELEASNKELEAFSYSVSHDLRAPLRSMEGFSTALLEDYMDKLDEQGKQYLKYIQGSSDLMGKLIDDLLRLSRVTRSEMTYEQVNLSELAYSILAEMEKREPERMVQVEIAPCISAYGDRNLLRLALENILGNAWKFTSRTAASRIEMGVTENKGKQSYFIRDNGVGFDMAFADKLFKPFQRLHRATEFPGTGIGLATVQRIIRRHGGEVWAEGKPGEGAVFYFTLSKN